MKSFVQVAEKRIVKGIILLLILLFATALVGFLGLQMPYRAYEAFKEDGIHGRLIKSNKPSLSLLRADVVTIDEDFDLDSDKLWTNLEFDNFVLPMPLSHPVLGIRPRPILYGERTLANLDYVDAKNELLLSFTPLKVSKGNFTFPSDKIFKLPLVRKYILKKGKNKIWNDIYTKNLDFKVESYFNISKFKKLLSDVPPLEVAYNLYIYKLRERLFPTGTSAVNVVKGGHVIFKVSPTSQSREQDKSYIGMFLLNGKFYSYRIKMAKSNNYSSLVLRRLMNSMSVMPTRGALTLEKIYSQYRTFPFKQRVSSKGLVYLYSAWSHDMENKNIMREAIQFLERGKELEKQLLPLYKYSLDKWGTTLSSKERFLKEDAKNKLKRKIEEEKRKEEEELSDFEVIDKFKTNEERIQYKLKRAKRANSSKVDEQEASPRDDDAILIEN